MVAGLDFPVAAAPEAEGLVPKALPEKEEDLIETAVVVHSDCRLAAAVAAADSAGGSVVPKARFGRMKAAEPRLAAAKESPGARFATVLVHSDCQSAASVAAADFAADLVVAKARSVRMEEAESRPAVGWAAGKEWPEARFARILVHSAGRLAATAAPEASADSVDAKEAWSRPAARSEAEKAFVRTAAP